MKRQSFTLVELIVALVVAMIILGMTVATYQKIVGGKQVDAAVAAVGANLMRGRQLAIARRNRLAPYVALIMPGANAAISNEKKFSCFRLAYVTYNESTSRFEFYSWPEDTKWEFTGPGCTIMEVDADWGVASVTASGAAYEKVPKDDSFAMVDNVDLAGLGKAEPETNDGIRALVFTRTGRVKGSSRFVTIGEANFNTGTWIIQKHVKETGGPANQITIEANRFTGSISYRHPDNYPPLPTDP